MIVQMLDFSVRLFIISNGQWEDFFPEAIFSRRGGDRFVNTLAMTLVKLVFYRSNLIKRSLRGGFIAGLSPIYEETTKLRFQGH
jgi:hypothetical protein